MLMCVSIRLLTRIDNINLVCHVRVFVRVYVVLSCDLNLVSCVSTYMRFIRKYQNNEIHIVKNYEFRQRKSQVFNVELTNFKN